MKKEQKQEFRGEREYEERREKESEPFIRPSYYKKKEKSA